MTESMSVKIFDATVLISLLDEMNCADTVADLAKRYAIVVPQGVASEITKQPAKKRLWRLTEQGLVKVATLSPEAQVFASSIRGSHTSLHLGESEAIALLRAPPSVRGH